MQEKNKPILGYVQDSGLIKDGELYYNDALNRQYFSGYLERFSPLIIIGQYIEKAHGNTKLLSQDDIRVMGIPKSNFATHNKNNRRMIREFVQKINCCIVKLPSSIGNLVIKYCKKYHVPYIVEVLGDPFQALWYHSFKAKPFAVPAYFRMKKDVKNAPMVRYVTERFLQQKYPTRGQSLAYSDVVLPYSDCLEKRKEKIQNLDIKNISLATCGMVGRYKGQQFVIRAIKILKQHGYKVRYNIVGVGEIDKLKKLAEREGVSECVKFWGTVLHETVFEILDESDIYIQPSLTEGLPRAVLEALSRACLCMGTRTCGIPELIEEKYLFGKKRYKEIAKIIMSLTQEDYLQQAQHNVQVAAKYVQTDYRDKEKMLLDYLEANV